MKTLLQITSAPLPQFHQDAIEDEHHLSGLSLGVHESDSCSKVF